jgi:hypothetical protein
MPRKMDGKCVVHNWTYLYTFTFSRLHFPQCMSRARIRYFLPGHFTGFEHFHFQSRKAFIPSPKYIIKWVINKFPNPNYLCYNSEKIHIFTMYYNSVRYFQNTSQEPASAILHLYSESVWKIFMRNIDVYSIRLYVLRPIKHYNIILFLINIVRNPGVTTKKSRNFCFY